MALGLLGGTFDPPHLGHLVLGECARIQFDLERVCFMPAGDPYRKAARGVTAASDRLAMTRLAIADNGAFGIDAREVERVGPTYTRDTLRELKREGIGEIVLILGGDALADMPNWQDPREIASLAQIVIAPKGLTDAAIARHTSDAGLGEPPPVVEMPALPISSSLIRERVRRRLPVRYLVPPAVDGYIRERGLYR